MADKAARDARIEDHGDIAAGIDLARIDALDHPLAGTPADQLRIVEIGCKQTAVEIVVALHLRALAGDDADGAAEAAGHIGAGKSVRSNENHSAHAGRGAGSRRIGDACDIEGRLFHLERHVAHRIGGDFGRIEQVEIGVISRKVLFIREAGEGILGRDLCHGDCAFGQHLQIETRIGGNACNLVADEDTQREIVAFRGFGSLHLSEPDADGTGAGADDHRIRLVGARRLGQIDQFAGTRQKGGGIDLRGHVCKPFVCTPFIVHRPKHQGQRSDSPVDLPHSRPESAP